MSDPSSASGDAAAADATTNLAADPTAGTDEQFDMVRTADDVGTLLNQRDDPDPGRQRWASVNHPITLGFSITLGGLMAVLIALAIGNLSTIVIYVVFALFVALGLDPVVKWLESHRIKRAWGIVIVYAVFAIVFVGIMVLIIPTLVTQISTFITTLPQQIANFEKSSTYAWIEKTFGDQTGQLLTEVQKWLTNPANLALIG